MKQAKEIGTILNKKLVRVNLVIADFSPAAQRVLNRGMAQGHRWAYWTTRLRKGTEAHDCDEASGAIAKAGWWMDDGAYFTFDETAARNNLRDYVVISLNGGHDG
jgi:hypothetical protein